MRNKWPPPQETCGSNQNSIKNSWPCLLQLLVTPLGQLLSLFWVQNFARGQFPSYWKLKTFSRNCVVDLGWKRPVNSYSRYFSLINSFLGHSIWNKVESSGVCSLLNKENVTRKCVVRARKCPLHSEGCSVHNTKVCKNVHVPLSLKNLELHSSAYLYVG